MYLSRANLFLKSVSVSRVSNQHKRLIILFTATNSFYLHAASNVQLICFQFSFIHGKRRICAKKCGIACQEWNSLYIRLTFAQNIGHCSGKCSMHGGIFQCMSCWYFFIGKMAKISTIGEKCAISMFRIPIWASWAFFLINPAMYVLTVIRQFS